MIHRSFSLPLATTFSLIGLLVSVHLAHAASIVWSTTTIPTLYMSQGTVCTSLLYGTSVNVAYHADAVNADTGEPICGQSVPSGTKVTFQFAAHTWQDVNWFASGYNYDTPYGDWSADAAPPAPADYCTEHNYINSWGTYQPLWGRYSKNSTYVPLRVAPPADQSVTGLEGFDCGTPESDGSVTCTAKVEGNTTPTFNFSDTYGKFYPAISYDPAWGYPPCGAGKYPLRVPEAGTVYLWNQGIATGGYDLLRSDSCSARDDYKLAVPKQFITCPITITPRANTPPSVPTVTGSCIIGQPSQFGFQSTDSEGDQIRYGVDWDADGTVDQWIPASGYADSGSRLTLSRTYSSDGQKTIKVLAKDETGALSAWSSFEFDCFEPPLLTCSVTFDQNPISEGESTTVHWSSTGAAVFYLNSIGYVGASGSATVSPSYTTDFSGYVSSSASGGGEASYCPAMLRVNQADAECPPDTHLVNGVCVANNNDSGSCDIGYVYQGGACVFTSCPVGYVKQGAACVFQGCPVGYTLQNGACVWSGCPEGFIQQGNQCVLENQCTSLPYCQGNDLRNGCTHERIQTCQYGCANGACRGVPSPTAALSATPAVVIKGKTTKLSWNSANTASCTLTGGNGDSFTGLSAINKVSGPLNVTTVFTLRCEGYDGSSPAFVEKKVTVSVRPSWSEE